MSPHGLSDVRGAWLHERLHPAVDAQEAIFRLAVRGIDEAEADYVAPTAVAALSDGGVVITDDDNLLVWQSTVLVDARVERNPTST